MGKTSEGRSKRLDGALKAGGGGDTMIRMEEDVYQGQSLKGRVRLNKKHTDIHPPAGLCKRRGVKLWSYAALCWATAKKTRWS